MTTSQNGWSAAPDLHIRPLVVAGESFSPGIRDNDDVYTVLQYVAEQVHARVEPIVRDDWHQADDWGFFYRANANDPNSLSNHSSGTAIDYNATRHPNGVATSRTFTPKQIAEIHKILDEVRNVVRWGGDYHFTPDSMHFEINAGAEAVASVANRLRRPSIRTVVATVNLNFGRPAEAQQRLLDRIKADIVCTQEDVRGKHRERVLVRKRGLTLRSGHKLSALSTFGLRIRKRRFAWKDIAVPGVGVVRVICGHMPPRRFPILWPIYSARLRKIIANHPRSIFCADLNKRLGQDPAELKKHFGGQFYGERIDGIWVSPMLTSFVRDSHAGKKPFRDGHVAAYVTLGPEEN